MVPRSVTTPLMRPFSMTSDFAGVLAKACSLPDVSPWSTSLPATVCERGMTRPASGSHRPPCTSSSSISGNFSLISAGLDQARAGAERLGRGDLALDLVHAGVVADAGDFEAADAGVVAHLLVEIDGVERRPAGQEVVAGRVAEVGGMRRRADVGRDAGLVDADDVVPAALDQVMGDGCAHDAAQPDDDDLRLFRKLLTFFLSSSRSGAGMTSFGSPELWHGKAAAHAGGDERVVEQADRHRPDAARHRGDRARDLRAAAKSTSPTSALAVPWSTRLMPTSITVAPGLIQSPSIISGRPTAATRMSARRQTAAGRGCGSGRS